jgi:oligopeptidase B
MEENGTNGSPQPPVARTEPRVETWHGERRVDEYHWMRRKDDPDLLAYLEAENAYTGVVMKPTEALQEALYKEMLGRIKETDMSVPYRFAGSLWYSRTEQGKQYPIYCRKKGGPDAPEQIVLDLNELGAASKFVAIGAFAVGHRGERLAYSLDLTGFRDYTLHVKDLATGELGSEAIPRVKSVAWASDDRTLFYVVDDEAKRPYRLYRHQLGEPHANDALLYEETDEMFAISVDPSRSRAYIFLTAASHTASEVRILRSDSPLGSFQLISPREPDHEYDVEHRGGRFFIRTNGGGRRNFRIVTAPIEDPAPARWEEVVPHREDVMIEGIDLFEDHMVVHEREGGLPHLRVTGFREGRSHRVVFPEPVYAVFPYANPEFQAASYRFTYQSFKTPVSVFEYGMDHGERQLLKQEEILGGYDPQRYVTERIEARAPDGALVPVSIVRPAGAPRDGSSALLLSGYGSYGYSLPVQFSSARLSLLDRGISFAIAHVRGGGEMGKRWHDAGRMMAKSNTFTDFIAVAEHLIAAGVTSPERLVIEGGSAGGLLVGAVTNMRPDLFKAVVAQVPFVDVVNTMLDESLPLTVGEFEEWGNPKIPEQYRAMRAYSPYDNLEPKDYPAILVKTAYNDSQVMYWEPAKYVARLRTLKRDGNPLLLKIDLAPAGHGGASGRYDRLREIAFVYAFVLDQLGIRA